MRLMMEPLSPTMIATLRLRARLRPVLRQRPRPQQKLRLQLSKQDIEKKTFHKNPAHTKNVRVFFICLLSGVSGLLRDQRG